MSPDDVARGTSERSPSEKSTSQNPEYATWLTKQQAADALKVTPKTIEQWTKDGDLQQAFYRPQNRGPLRAVYNPDDVARIAKERQPGLRAFVLPAGVTPPVNGNGHQTGISPLTTTPSGEEVIRLVFAAALQALTSENRATSENSEKLFLTIPEAAAELRLTVPCVRRLIKARGIATVRDADGLHIRRKDLEAL
jgi:hypothetical protein